MLFLFAIIYGFAHGGLFTVMSPMVAELFGTGSHGLLFGIVLFSGDIGGAIGPLLAGHIFDLTGSYRLVFLILIALAVVGFILITYLFVLMLARPSPTDSSEGPFDYDTMNERVTAWASQIASAVDEDPFISPQGSDYQVYVLPNLT